MNEPPGAALTAALSKAAELGYSAITTKSVTALLGAAAPLIAAAERDRLSQPGDGDPQFCQVCGADLPGRPGIAVQDEGGVTA